MKRLAVLVLLGTIIGVALVEAGLRLVGGDGPWVMEAERLRWVPHPFLPYAGRPLGKFTHHNQRYPENEHIEHNSYGFRTHEFPSQVAPEDIVILCFGESTTYGTTASNDRTWPERLERILAAQWPQRRIHVFNLGIDMATTAVSVVNLGLVGVHLNPDIVIVYHGNDMMTLGSPKFHTDHSHFYRDIDLPDVVMGIPPWLAWSYAARYFYLTVAFRGNDLFAVATVPGAVDMGTLFVDGPERFRGMEATLENLHTMHSIVAGIGGRTLFSTYHVRDPNPVVTRYNDRLRRFFSENDFAYVDQERLIPDNDPTINFDFCHFTEKGDEMMAQNFADAIIASGWVAAAALVPQGGTVYSLPADSSGGHP